MAPQRLDGSRQRASPNGKPAKRGTQNAADAAVPLRIKTRHGKLAGLLCVRYVATYEPPALRRVLKRCHSHPLARLCPDNYTLFQ
jgi:hypothetical protein